MCLLQEFERSRAFGFLNEVKKRFQTTYGSRAQTALPYAMNSEFSSTLAAQMVLYTPRPALSALCSSVCSDTLLTQHCIGVSTLLIEDRFHLREI